MSSTKPDVSLSLTLPSPTHNETFRPEERGLLLIQLLLSCAKNTSSGNLHRADAYLQKISELTSVVGDSMQRLTVRFASALAVRIVKRWPGLYKALNNAKLAPGTISIGQAQSVLTAAYPYLALAYAIVDRTLVRALTMESEVHIVDLGAADAKLWVPLIRGLAQGPAGPPLLRITCVSTKKEDLDVLGLALVKEAKAVGMSFQFNPVNVSLGELTTETLKVRSGEALAIVSTLSLHVLLAEDDRVEAHFGGGKSDSVKDSKRMGEFLAKVRSMSPKVFFLIEQEADHNTSRLLDRLVEGLHYYSAVFDSLDSAFGRNCSEERLALEEMVGREIENIISCEGLDREERHERHEKWMVRFSRAGFKPIRLWWNAMEDAKCMVESYLQEGYKVVCERGGTLICWHDRPLFAVSAWSC